MTVQWYSQTPFFAFDSRQPRRGFCPVRLPMRQCPPVGMNVRHHKKNNVTLEPFLLAQLALLGLCTGFLAGLLGLGGGMLMVPFVTFILGSQGYPEQYSVKMAVATSLATICFTSMASVRAHHRRGAVLWRVVRLLAPGIVLGSLLGAQAAVALPTKVLSVLFALFVAFSATQIFLDRKPKPTRTLPDRKSTRLNSSHQ